MDSLLQKAGDIIPAACRPYEGVGFHGDVSSHQLGRFLPAGATAVSNPIMIHAKPRKPYQSIREMITIRRVLQLLLAGTDQQKPFSPLAAHGDSLARYSRVANLMGNGEGCGQANVLIDAAASFSFTHATHWGQA